jgi:type IV pilus assembly protein PilY1
MKIRQATLSLLTAFLLLLPFAAPAATLADTPLSLKGGVPPNVMFALSVEFPTANTAAYQGVSDYSANNEYLGYFDQDKCYGYDIGNGWFAPNGSALNHACNNAWSGNFLNWSTMTGLDEFRYAMTGGNRNVDTATQTVLERSYQSGQGGTSNFPDKTWTENGSATPFPNNTAITIKNQGNGIQMVVYPNGSDVANCTNPNLSGSTFTCGAITQVSDATAGSCTSYTGSGTLAAPYRCATFGAFGSVTPSSSTTRTTSTASTAPANVTVTCTNPDFTPAPFDCTLTMSTGVTGSCSTWSGSGTSGAPYTCSSFGFFGGNQTFSPANTGKITTSFNAVVAGTQTSESLLCSINAGPSVSCTMANGDGATCTTFDTKNTTTCTAFGFTTGGATSTKETYVSSARTDNHNTTVNSKKYYDHYTITYTPQSTKAVYYISSYSGSDSIGYYYVSAYNLAYGTALPLNVRVKVCDQSAGPETNCKQYGTSLKPTGSVQDNGDVMRFGVMSYFQANDTDNAVLRSKLKYVAPTKYSSSGTTITNPNTEWSSSDGTLLSNPDSTDSATANSFVGAVSNTGVINYINKFGSASHSYKTYDDVGKLYYESLKYLRGLAPTPDFYRGAKAANSDGFPVITTWDDPVLYTCQKNFIITMGDTHTWCDKRLPGGTYTAANNAVCNAYTDSNGNAHVADTGSLAGDTGLNVTTLTNAVGGLEGLGNIATSYTGAGPSASYNMAGLAYWAASQDIRPTMTGTQHVQTYVIDVQENQDCGYQSQFWLAAKFGRPDSYATDGSWLTTNNPSLGTLTLPAGNCASGAPTGYTASGGAVTWPNNLLRAGDPLSMISSVKSALAAIVAQIGNEAALAQSSGTLDTGTGAYIYRASYNSGGWQGDLQALSISTSGAISSTPAWKASAMLPAAASRNIFSFNDGLKADGTIETTATSRRGFAFTSNNLATSFSSGQQDRLNRNDFNTVDSLGANRIDWLRGDQSQEIFLPGTKTPNPTANNGWRPRASLLGDVINSNPVFVARPSSQPGAGFATFAAGVANRTPMIYVGGNDGMLHAYDASYTVNASGVPTATTTSGKEVFAYVPAAVYANLPKLMNPNYSHKFFTDGSPVVSEACFGNSAGTACSAAASWKTMLVSGLNAGGQGVYALDVSNPSSFDASKVLWEFTDADDADLGYTFGKPLIRKLNNQKWAVIFGSGYNNTFADGHASTTGRAYLYILYVDGPGAGNRWVLNTNYFKIALPSPSEGGSPTLPLTPPNGLASVVSVDRDQNGTADIVYGGDRNGNVWKIDLSSSTPASWAAAFGTTTAPLPLFTAKTGATTPVAQQITSGLEVGLHPKGGYIINFGTGSWVDVTDPIGPFTTDTFYGIWDKDDGSTRVTRASLQPQAVLAWVDSGTGALCTAGAANCVAVMSTCKPNYGTTAQTTSATPLCPSSLVAPANTAQQLGWVVDLPGTGERTRSDQPKISSGVVTFTSLTPAIDPCAGNTLGIEYNLSSLTGGAPSQPVYVFPGNSSGLVTTTAIPGAGGASLSVVVVGKVIAGGASDNPITFKYAPPASVVPLPNGVAPPPTGACTGTACNALGSPYIPGWGFLMNMQGPTAAGRNYVLSCHPPEFGNGDPICEPKRMPGQFGRLDWKQITR